MIEITNWYELYHVRDDLSESYILMNDLDENTEGYEDVNSGMGFPPISTFTGTFDGNDHTISGLTINAPSYDNLGLFGGMNGVVKNLGIINANITGKDVVATIVGVLGGSVTNCYSTGIVTGRSWVGGMVGWCQGAVTNCYTDVSITSSNSRAGGLIGSNYSTITNCYSVGSVVGVYNVGGLVGLNNNGSYVNCYYDKETSGQSDTGKGTPKTTLEMKQQATFTNWNFDDVWRIDEGVSYPELQWQIPPKPIIIRKLYIGGEI